MLKTLKDYLKYIITGVLLVGSVLLVYVTLDVEFEWTASHLVRMVVAIVTQIVLIATWLPDGKRKGENDEKYQNNLTCVSAGVVEIEQNSLYDELERFCEYATKQNIDTFITQHCNRLNIDYKRSLVDKTYTLTDRQKKRVARITRVAHFVCKPLQPTSITSCSVVQRYKFDITNYEKGKERGSVAYKFACTILLSVLGVSLSFAWATSFADGLLEAVYWLGVIAGTVWFSQRTGVRLITVTRNDYFKRLIDFFNRFRAWREKEPK